jgi:hypothetical protein
MQPVLKRRQCPLVEILQGRFGLQETGLVDAVNHLPNGGQSEVLRDLFKMREAERAGHGGVSRAEVVDHRLPGVE